MQVRGAWLGRIPIWLKLGAILGVSIFLIEMIIMLAEFLPTGHVGALMDAALLTAFVSPIAYLILARPLATQIAERDLAQAGLVQAHAQLEDFSHGLERRVAERTDALAAVNHTSTALSHCLTTDEVLQTGLGLVCEATAVDGGVVWLTRDGGMELAARRNLDETIVGQLDRLTSVYPEMRHALGLRAPSLLDGSAIPTLDDILDAKSSPGARLLTVPLMSRDSVLGALGLVLPTGTQCDEAKLQLSEAIGAQLGVAIENAGQYDRARYLAERDSVTDLYNHRSLHSRVEQELNRAQRVGGTFSLVMMDLDGFKLFNDTYGHPSGDDVLRVVASVLSATVRNCDIVGRYGGDEFMAILPDTGGQGAVDLAQRVRNTLIERPYLAPGSEGIPLHLSFGIASYPADGRHVNELIGLADGNLYNSKQRGGDMITAVEEGEEDRHGQGSGMFGVLDALVTAVDNKDRYTREHSEDVTRFALAIAEHMSLSDVSLRALRIAGLLHDVGKIGVPDRILRKPGRLTADEFDVVRQHAGLSEIIVKGVPNLTEVMAAVGSHHERWDGTGYPRGLEGTDIPFLGRILAVADAWSAMTTDRPYRAALTPAAARDELLRGSGSQFDPTIVPAFLADIDADVGLLPAVGSPTPSEASAALQTREARSTRKRRISRPQFLPTRRPWQARRPLLQGTGLLPGPPP